MAHGHHDTSLSWEWDSVLLLANPSLHSSPSREPDGSASGGLRKPGSSVHRRHQRHEQWHANENSITHTQADSVSSETLDRGSNGDRARDPRLDCPNFLAGRVPCACTDNDDDGESGVSRKRSKPVPRCQVVACSADLTDLKGYHQRHRVCLRCAHATRVTLRELPHRYCQQCGKFHPICDFDEGKRSCRRKLERHNNRRRRKLNEDGLPALDGGEFDTQNDSSPVHGTSNSTKYDGGSEGEPKSLSGEHLAPDAEQGIQIPGSVSSMDKLDNSFLVKASESSIVPDDVVADVALPVLETSLATHSKEIMPISEPSLGSVDVSQRVELQYGEEQSGSPRKSVMFSVEAHQNGVHVMSPDDFSLHSSAPSEPESGHIKGGNEEESLLALLLGEKSPREDSQFSKDTEEHHFIRETIQPWECSTSPESLSKQVSYSSPLPVGRISFKLYDWNPGDFPRQLRQQVMDWLSNMPVDLEGYIRSGCTILTIFAAMPQFKWDELNADWAGSVLKLVKAEQSLFRFWSCGYLTARMDNSVVHINNGDLAHSPFERMASGEPPVLHRVRPLCLEVGCEEDVEIFGDNIEQPHTRLLVSFEGKYVVNSACQSHPNGATKATYRNEEKVSMSMPALHRKTCGTAYIEVEHMGGTSNYIPLLVADKEIVDEVRTLEKELDRPTSCCNQNIDGSSGFPHLSQRRVHSLLLDLGWVLRAISYKTFKLDNQTVILELHSERLRRLLFFAVERSWSNVVERVLQLANSVGLMEKIGVLENGLTALQVALLHHNLPMAEHLIGCATSICVSSKCKFWWSVDFPGPQGVTAVHIGALLPEALGFLNRLVETKVQSQNFMICMANLPLAMQS